MQWVVKGAVDVNIGANPSAEGGEDEGVDDTAVKVVDIVDVFRLQVRATMNISLSWRIHFLKLIFELLSYSLISEHNYFV